MWGAGMSSIDYAMGRANATREDMVYMGRNCANAVGEEYDKLTAGEQRVWQNAMLAMQFRKSKLPQDILERALGRQAYDAAVTKVDKYESKVVDQWTADMGQDNINRLMTAVSVQIEERCKVFGLDPLEASAEIIHAIFTGVLADSFRTAGETDLCDSLKNGTSQKVWNDAMAWNKRYADATGGTS